MNEEKIVMTDEELLLELDERLSQIREIMRPSSFWEKDNSFGDDAYVCHLCQAIWNTQNIKNFNFCPSCGADMTNGNEEVNIIVPNLY